MPESQEIWIEAENGQNLCALINDDIVWLMYLADDGDTCYSSHNPDHTGPATALQSYKLSNGQVDEYPVAWALPSDEVRRALDYFKSEGQLPPFIAWHKDYGEDL